MKQQRIVDNSQSILNRSLIFMSGNYTAVPSEVDGLDLLKQFFFPSHCHSFTVTCLFCLVRELNLSGMNQVILSCDLE